MFGDRLALFIRVLLSPTMQIPGQNDKTASFDILSDLLTVLSFNAISITYWERR
jgi:hypothetical protein